MNIILALNIEKRMGQSNVKQTSKFVLLRPSNKNIELLIILTLLIAVVNKSEMNNLTYNQYNYFVFMFIEKSWLILLIFLLRSR